ncbi:hypothetical protein PCANB_002229 [Pneumocystis canis]|nr:hypothetical protein PCK1_002352 [Pneumocystis canis]KAG5438899.1 hypothetical protein PCANB_002229 [Pneumocystis canis]
MKSPRIQGQQTIQTTVAPGDSLRSLEACVSSLNACNYRMDLLLAALDTGIHDFPRIQSVLSNQRNFEVVTESDVKKAQQVLKHEIYPRIEALLQRAEMGINKLERCEKTLQGKAELQEIRLPSMRSKHTLMEITEQQTRRKELYALRLQKQRLIHALDQLSFKSQ